MREYINVNGNTQPKTIPTNDKTYKLLTTKKTKIKNNRLKTIIKNKNTKTKNKNKKKLYNPLT